MKRLRQIDSELRAMELRREELVREREKLLTAAHLTEAAVAPLSPDEKIALFLCLFRCREDVYPRLWENPQTGMKGYSPVCRNEWFRGVCEKPRVKCSECLHQAFPPLDEVAAKDHLTGKSVIGTYAIRGDNTCVFLAADFDGAGWKEDVIAYRDAAREFGIEVTVERSRSGDGGHAWIFFSEPVSAMMARRLGTLIVAKASSLHPAMALSSYDRFRQGQSGIVRKLMIRDIHLGLPPENARMRISCGHHFASAAEREIFSVLDSKPVQAERTITSLSDFCLKV